MIPPTHKGVLRYPLKGVGTTTPYPHIRRELGGYLYSPPPLKGLLRAINYKLPRGVGVSPKTPVFILTPLIKFATKISICCKEVVHI